MMAEYNAKSALFANTLDYAGTFPPAEKKLEEALEEAANLRRNLQFPQFYSRMAILVSHLEALTPDLLFKMNSDGSPWVFTAIGGNFDNEENITAYQKFLKEEILRIKHVATTSSAQSMRVWISAFETKIPNYLFQDRPQALVPHLENLIRSVQSLPAVAYLEVGLGDKWKSNFNSLCEALRALNLDKGHPSAPGLKMRTGGKIVPSALELAHFISMGVRTGLRLKVTQGLHHAFTTTGSWGFLNVFAAVHFAYALGLESFNEASIQEILEERDSNAFTLKPDALVWKDYVLSLDQIETARQVHQLCFGSCSAIEPDLELQKLVGLAN